MTTPQVVTLPQLVTVPDVEIVAAGTWDLSTGQATFTTQDLASAVQASQCPAVGSPVLKLGHIDPRFDGEPAVGRVSAMRITSSGNKITADLAGMPAWLGQLLPSAYPNRSIEGSWNFKCSVGHTHPFVITALALLGVARPGVGVLNELSDVASLYGVAAASDDKGSMWTLRFGGGVMADGPSPAVTVEDIRRAYYDNSTTPPSYWITEIQLAPPQLIVCDESSGTSYRVPVTMAADGSVSFGDPVAVFVQYVDSPQPQEGAAASARFGSPKASRAVQAAWSASTQVKNLGADPTQAQIDALFALPGDTKSDSKLPHHDVSSDGTVGAADLDGVDAAIGALNGSQGGVKDVSEADRKKAYDHLAAHMTAGGKTPPDFKAAGAMHPYDGTHTHAHSAMGSQGGDAGHEHEHTHSGDGNHDHHGAATATASIGGEPADGNKEAADMQFSDDQLKALRARLGKSDGEELTADEVLAAIAQPTPAEPAKPATSQVPEGTMLVDEAAWRAMQERVAAGETARAEQLRDRRDRAISAAIGAGKTPPARREHWQKSWDVDPEGTEQVLASLAPGLIPLADIGTPGDESSLTPGGVGDDGVPEEFRELFPDWAKK